MKKTSKVSFFNMMLLPSIGLILFVILSNFSFDLKIALSAFILLVIILVNIILIIINRNEDRKNSQPNFRRYLINELENNDLQDKQIDRLNESEKGNTNENWDSTIIQIREDKKDIIALMLKNNDEITDYFKISKSQARSSFWFSVVFCVVGLVCLVFGICAIVILKNVSVSVISLIGGTLSEFISGTIFWLHNKSALQLNHYYEALHENEKFLSAVNIADRLSDERREEMLVEIIRNQISTNPSKNETENNK